VIRKLEVLANVAVLITAVVLCSVLIKKYVFTAPPNQAAAATQRSASNAATRRGIQRGTKISLPGVDWSQSDLTLVLALSTTCRFCTDSAPLYQKLQQQRRPDVRVIAALPQSIEESKNYLRNLGIDLPGINQFPPCFNWHQRDADSTAS
jgi:hypothetical protein